ncbi:MAG: hypothetical protein OEY51_02610, partial [Cyclobacteriaceae bacterium]|nr:hypothetical protein [Cyclobacteriaceae bacterium]
IVAVSARWMPSHSVENSFFTPLLLLPRLAAIVLVYMAFVRIKKTARHKPLMIFSETGIRVEDTEYSWISISALHFSEGTNVARDHPSLIITTSEGVKIKVNLHNIDEFPEDVAVTANRYFKKFGAKRAL